jgi:hypothetical protein
MQCVLALCFSPQVDRLADMFPNISRASILHALDHEGASRSLPLLLCPSHPCLVTHSQKKLFSINVLFVFACIVARHSAGSMQRAIDYLLSELAAPPNDEHVAASAAAAVSTAVSAHAAESVRASEAAAPPPLQPDESDDEDSEAAGLVSASDSGAVASTTDATRGAEMTVKAPGSTTASDTQVAAPATAAAASSSSASEGAFGATETETAARLQREHMLAARRLFFEAPRQS